MSIVVCRWVWANSQAEHGSRLVLLAIADCCNNDDGTGAWPSLAELMRKTRMSARAVQNALKDLSSNDAKQPELKIEPNAGPGGVNRYIVLMTPAISAGGARQKRVRTPADSARTPADSAPVTIKNHQEPPPPPSSPPAAPNGAGHGTAEAAAKPDTTNPAVAEILRDIALKRPLGRKHRDEAETRLNAALNAGWTHKKLVDAFDGCNQAHTPVGAFMYRLRNDLDEPPTDETGTRATAADDWCGTCDQATRQIHHGEHKIPARCPTCHPNRQKAAA